MCPITRMVGHPSSCSGGCRGPPAHNAAGHRNMTIWPRSYPLGAHGPQRRGLLPPHQGLRGHGLGEVAEEKGTELVDAMLLLLAENELMVKVAGIMSGEDLRGILKHPLAMISTDAFCLDKPLDEKASIHPRHYGTYPVVLGQYVREEGILTLEEAVRKMTSLPARRVGLLDRGVILAGAWADLVVFDPSTIANRSTIEAPAQFPAGIHYVLVNGKIAIAGDEYRDVRAGQVLRKGHP